MASALAASSGGSPDSSWSRARGELARGDVACELAQRGLVLGLGERIAADGPGHGVSQPFLTRTIIVNRSVTTGSSFSSRQAVSRT